MTRVALALLALSLSGCGSSCMGPPPPTSDTCEASPNAPRPTVTDVEIGYLGPGGVFTPILPDDEVPLVIGGQGSDMVVAALRVTGTGLPSCLPQSTRLLWNGEEMSSESAPLRTRPLSSSLVQTGEIFLPWYGPSGQRATITSTVAPITSSISFGVDYEDLTDAPLLDASDGPSPDGPPDGLLPPPDAPP